MMQIQLQWKTNLWTIWLPITLSEPEGHFCSLKLLYNSGNIACFNYNVFTHKSENTHGF